ncbi:MAG: Asp-tRNA(Asn)/Glu-tRNA(Gln) amidotransferase subunit GatB [Alphaproteobacteria bacterium]|nr:Asp-tRNA(Asn)/Glu-tRNA(Gln) amidotransferase subunit GatB [Alphaproteobacteria bacterium]
MGDDAVIEGATGSWEVVIGLEVHAQVISDAKLFSGAATAFGAEPNTQVSFIDAAMPGTLPVINEACVAQAVRTGLGLNAEINRYSVFDRKNYFYPDLPPNYQISQYAQPVVGPGMVRVDLEDGSVREVGIERLHLEQDAGKSLHDRRPDATCVDLNRAGVALMEIVSRPDLRGVGEAGAYIRKLRAILRYLGTCDGNMEQGSLRCDVNVSVRRPGAPLGTRCEIKNVNSVRFVQQAIDYEARRQIDILEGGGEIEQETRLFDADRGVTRSMRRKEEAHDYRYFPDPDLLPLELSDAYIDAIRAGLPELPDQKKVRFVEQLGLSEYDAGVLVAEKEVADYFERVADGREAKTASNWVTGELFGKLNESGREITDSPVSPDDLGDLIDLVADGTLSGRLAKEVFDAMFESGRPPGEIVEERGLEQVSDRGEIEALVDTVVGENADKVEEYRAGKDKLFGFFVGQVMKASQGRANPKVVNDILRQKLD